MRGYGKRWSCFDSYGMVPISLEILTHKHLIDPCEFISILDIMIQAGINAILQPFSIYMGDMKVKTIEILRKKSYIKKWTANKKILIKRQDSQLSF